MKNLPNFKHELLLSFIDIGQKSALVYSQMGWYELATYTLEENDGVFSKVPQVEKVKIGYTPD
jgi:hypothetical protein